jgi:hypothetical protein
MKFKNPTANTVVFRHMPVNNKPHEHTYIPPNGVIDVSGDDVDEAKKAGYGLVPTDEKVNTVIVTTPMKAEEPAKVAPVPPVEKPAGKKFSKGK